MKLNGEGFESLINVDEKVTQGQPLMKVNLAYFESARTKHRYTNDYYKS